MTTLPKATIQIDAKEIFASMMSVRQRLAASGNKDALDKKSESTADKAILDSVERAGGNFMPDQQVRDRLNAVTRGLVTLPSAPHRIEDSGLIRLDMTYDESQIYAMETLLSHQYAALIGAAGTGKTTLIKDVLARLIYGKDGVEPIGIRALQGRQAASIAICTFTGIASSVIKSTLPSWLHPACKTIHTLLEYAPIDGNPGAFAPTRHALNKLDIDLLVIDEAGQLGLNMWHNILNALPAHTRILLSGDIQQLQPVADSPMFPFVLANAISDNPVWAVAELTVVHRQTGVGGNRVLEAAHEVLAGKVPTFDTLTPGQPWYVINVPLPPKTEDGHHVIVRAMDNFRRFCAADEEGKPETVTIYQPYEDLLLTAGNGYEADSKGSALQQAPLNDSLSRLIFPDTDTNQAYVIDAGRKVRQFAVGDRVMCLLNESPDREERVTNGMLGKITKIENNTAWQGDHTRFGTKRETEAYQLDKIASLFGKPKDDSLPDDFKLDFDIEDIAIKDTDLIQTKASKAASHKVTVEYKSGAVRTYSTMIEIENLQLAYALNTLKGQGSQCDTVFIVCHSACSFHMSREWFYTAITRARKRVVIFSNDLGMRQAVSKQQIYGKTIAEKIRRYSAMLDRGDKIVRLTQNDI